MRRLLLLLLRLRLLGSLREQAQAQAPAVWQRQRCHYQPAAVASRSGQMKTAAAAVHWEQPDLQGIAAEGCSAAVQSLHHRQLKQRQQRSDPRAAAGDGLEVALAAPGDGLEVAAQEAVQSSSLTAEAPAVEALQASWELHLGPDWAQGLAVGRSVIAAAGWTAALHPHRCPQLSLLGKPTNRTAAASGALGLMTRQCQVLNQQCRGLDWAAAQAAGVQVYQRHYQVKIRVRLPGCSETMATAAFCQSLA